MPDQRLRAQLRIAEIEAALLALRKWREDHPPRKVEDVDTGEHL